MPDILESLHDAVQTGVGSPPPVDAVRRRASAQRRRRLIPVASVLAASVVAVGTVAIVHAARGAGLHRGGRPAASSTTIARREPPAVVVDTSLTPPGWVAVDWDDVQVSVPPGWSLNDPCESPDINFGPPHPLECPGARQSLASVEVGPITAVVNRWLRYSINGLRVLEPWATSAPGYQSTGLFVIPALHVQVSFSAIRASQAESNVLYRLVRTITYSPRDALFSDGAPPGPASTWRAVSFEGLSLRVPPADADGEYDTDDYPLLPCTNVVFGLPSGLDEDTDTQEVIPACVMMEPPTAKTFEYAEPGVFIDARVSAGDGAAGKPGGCLLLNKLDVCPYSAPYDVLYLKVSGGSLRHALLVRIGLSGNGLAARQILYSMHST
ncbi:MAG TPA: hypothetical protein VGP46_10850 [Acidimicrobiales bacterium]|nr:hypothetical protein [Acidimicrobiales bacterium]